MGTAATAIRSPPTGSPVTSRSSAGRCARPCTRIALNALTLAVGAPAARARLHPPLRPGHLVCLQGLSPGPCPVRDYPVHKPQGRLLGQRPQGEIFHTLKIERVHHRVYATRDQARQNLVRNTSRAPTIPVACTQPWATSTQLRSSTEQLNPVHFLGGRSLDEDVVHPAAASAHADAHLGILEHVGEARAGQLATLVGVEDRGRAATRYSLFQSLDAQPTSLSPACGSWREKPIQLKMYLPRGLCIPSVTSIRLACVPDGLIVVTALDLGRFSSSAISLAAFVATDCKACIMLVFHCVD